MITIRQVSPENPDAHELWAQQQADLAHRYDAPDLELETQFDTLVVSLVGYSDAGTPVATLVLRWSPYDTGAGSLEIKRLFVRPDHRGHGHSKVMMGAGEAIARRAGATQLVLMTGDGQPEAVALYERLGYSLIAPYGEYKDEPGTMCYAKALPPRVLIVSGTLGAGKTTVGGAIHELLAHRGARSAFLDADSLMQSYPPSPSDPTGEALLVTSLAKLAPVHRSRGVGNLVIAWAAANPEVLAALPAALAPPGTLADLTVVRLVAPLDVRRARLASRPAALRWREWADHYTVELEDTLAALDGDDAVVDTEDRAPDVVAAEVLAAAGW